MKNVALILCVLLIFISGHVEPGSDSIEGTVLALEKEANDRWSAGNPSGFSRHFADDASWFDDIAAQARLDGIREIQDYFKSLEGKVPPHRYKMVNTRFQVYGDMVILTYHYHSTMPDGQAGPPWKTTSVYHLDHGAWKLVHGNWSLINKP